LQPLYSLVGHPGLVVIDEAVIFQMVVKIVHHNIEHHPTKQLLQISRQALMGTKTSHMIGDFPVGPGAHIG
jgi:hypothetical protein